MDHPLLSAVQTAGERLRGQFGRVRSQLRSSIDGDCSVELVCEPYGQGSPWGQMRVCFHFSNSSIAEMTAWAEIAEEDDPEGPPEILSPSLTLQVICCYHAPSGLLEPENAQLQLHRTVAAAVAGRHPQAYAETELCERLSTRAAFITGDPRTHPSLTARVSEELTANQAHQRDWHEWSEQVLALFENCVLACGLERPPRPLNEL